MHLSKSNKIEFRKNNNTITQSESYETGTSLNQDLTFEYFDKEICSRYIKEWKSQMNKFYIKNIEGLYTNLAFLLSDQCNHTIRVNIFEENNKVITHKKEFTGSVLKQFQDTYDFVIFYNKNNYILELKKTNIINYPKECIKEILLNCVIHKDYFFSGSTNINIYNNKIEFISLGGLINEFELDSVLMGASQSRNIKLADLFCKMGYIENCGTGISIINYLYADKEKKPLFNASKGVFKVILPKFSTEKTHMNNTSDKKEMYKIKILNYIKENDFITRKIAEEILDIGLTSTYKILKDLCDKGKIEQIKNGRYTKYTFKRIKVGEKFVLNYD